MNVSWWFEIGLALGAIVGMLCVVLAMIYDLRAVSLNKLPHARRPHVTVIIVMSQTSEDIAACTKSIRRLHYRHYDIVVAIEAQASAATRRTARAAALHTRVYCARKATSRSAFIHRAYQRSQRGELVLLLDASQTITSATLNPAVAHLARSTAASLALGPTIGTGASIQLMTQTMGWLSWKMIMKAITATGLYHSRTLRSGRLYQSNTISNSLRYRLSYDSKTTITGVSVELSLRIGGYIAAAGLIIVVGYSSVLAATLQTTTPLLLSWSAISIWIAITIWLDDTIHFWSRVGLTFCLPISYFAIISALFAHGIKKILRHPTF